MLLGEDAAGGDQGREEEHPRTERCLGVHRRQHRDADVHAGEAVARRVELPYEEQELLRERTPAVQVAPVSGRFHGKEDEEGHLTDEQDEEAHGQMVEVPRGTDGPVQGDDRRIVEKAVDPGPAGAVGDPLVEGHRKLTRGRRGVTLTPEVELIDPEDEENRHHQMDRVVDGVHALVR